MLEQIKRQMQLPITILAEEVPERLNSNLHSYQPECRAFLLVQVHCQ